MFDGEEDERRLYSRKRSRRRNRQTLHWRRPWKWKQQPGQLWWKHCKVKNHPRLKADKQDLPVSDLWAKLQERELGSQSSEVRVEVLTSELESCERARKQLRKSLADCERRLKEQVTANEKLTGRCHQGEKLASKFCHSIPNRSRFSVLLDSEQQ